MLWNAGSSASSLRTREMMDESARDDSPEPSSPSTILTDSSAAVKPKEVTEVVRDRPAIEKSSARVKTWVIWVRRRVGARFSFRSSSSAIERVAYHVYSHVRVVIQDGEVEASSTVKHAHLGEQGPLLSLQTR